MAYFFPLPSPFFRGETESAQKWKEWVFGKKKERGRSPLRLGVGPDETEPKSTHTPKPILSSEPAISLTPPPQRATPENSLFKKGDPLEKRRGGSVGQVKGRFHTQKSGNEWDERRSVGGEMTRCAACEIPNYKPLLLLFSNGGFRVGGGERGASGIPTSAFM